MIARIACVRACVEEYSARHCSSDVERAVMAERFDAQFVGRSDAVQKRAAQR